MSPTSKEILKALAAAIAAIAAIVALVLVEEKGKEHRCLARWADSGTRARYVHPGGCQVEVERGRWLPETAVRR